MKKILSSLLTAAVTLSGTGVLGLTGIVRMDALTNVTARYLDGSLEPRLEELGTNNSTGVRNPEWRRIQEEGVKLHCARVLRAMQMQWSTKCGETVQRTLGIKSKAL